MSPELLAPEQIARRLAGQTMAASAEEAGLVERAEVTLSTGNWSAQLPVKIQPGLARGVMVIQRGMPGGTPEAIDRTTGETVVRFDGVSLEKTGKVLAVPILSGSLKNLC